MRTPATVSRASRRVLVGIVTIGCQVVLCGCGVLSTSLPAASVPLVDLEEPARYFDEPDDEVERNSLPLGSFTGVLVADSRSTLDELLEQGDGVFVEEVIENSPGDHAGIQSGDLLLEVRELNGEPARIPLRWLADWRRIELEGRPGTELRVFYDRAGLEAESRVVLEARLHPAGRHRVERFREEQRVGVVLRTATEVEARRAALGPGGGAVIVGLARSSPWRSTGIRYRDTIVEVAGEIASDPRVVLAAIDRAKGRTLELLIDREGERLRVVAPLSRRHSEVAHIHLPLLYRYRQDRDWSVHSVILGLFRLERTPVSWQLRLLWFIRFAGGESDRLEVIQP